MSDGQDRLTRGEIAKDAVQATAEAAATTVGDVATIITRAVKDVAGAIGGFATEVFEIRDASRRAAELHGAEPEQPGAHPGAVSDASSIEAPELP